MFNSRLLAPSFRAKSRPLLDLLLKASICHKSELPNKKVKHFPYEDYSWNMFTMWLDPLTKNKFNENSKIIQVEGNVSSGKHELAHKIADELGMKVFDDIDIGSYYTNDHGYDYRALNPLLPERMRLCDWDMFHENPSRHSVIHMQNYIFKMRLFQYLKALQHIFNTGQGVILVRSAFTEMVFVEAMHNLGWLPKGYLRGDGVRFYDWRSRYIFVRNLCLRYVFKPHLTIYLERPVDECMERIKSNSNPMISQSRALIPEFLQGIETAYNDIVLPKMDHNGFVLRVKCPEKFGPDDIGDVVDEITGLDFTYDHHDTRFETWDDSVRRLWYFNSRRYWTSLKCMELADCFYQPWYDIAGLGDSISSDDIGLRQSLYDGHVGPIGYYIAADRDIRYNNPISIFLDHCSFRRKFDEQLRTDFL